MQVCEERKKGRAEKSLKKVIEGEGDTWWEKGSGVKLRGIQINQWFSKIITIEYKHSDFISKHK